MCGRPRFQTPLNQGEFRPSTEKVNFRKASISIMTCDSPAQPRCSTTLYWEHRIDRTTKLNIYGTTPAYESPPVSLNFAATAD